MLLVITGGAMALYGDTVGEGFGVNFHIPNNGNFKGFADGELETMSRMFKVARFDLKWANIETTCGEYDFSEFDPIVASFLGAGIRPYAILDYANICYADDDQVCSSDKCVDGYSAWARAVTACAADACSREHTVQGEPVNGHLPRAGARGQPATWQRRCGAAPFCNSTTVRHFQRLFVRDHPCAVLSRQSQKCTNTPRCHWCTAAVRCTERAVPCEALSDASKALEARFPSNSRGGFGAQRVFKLGGRWSAG